MIERRLSEIASAVHGTLRKSDAVASSVETDSRAVGPGDLFVAIEASALMVTGSSATRSRAGPSPRSCIDPGSTGR